MKLVNINFSIFHYFFFLKKIVYIYIYIYYKILLKKLYLKEDIIYIFI